MSKELSYYDSGVAVDRTLCDDTIGSIAAVLYNRYVNRTENTNCWEFRQKAIDNAIRAFGDIKQWLNLQQFNTHLCDIAFDFIHDTVRYINTGERTVSTHTAGALIQAAVNNRVIGGGYTGRVVRQVILADALKVKPENLIQTWLSYEGGFEDMLCTMYILFGKRTKFVQSPRKDS